jgi:predicted dithiol-disulfide oxidoreductase (DUF899 family)
MSLPDVVSREQWLDARRELLAQEKEFTRQRDALNAERRRLPMVRIDKEYVFEGPDGQVTLADLFGDQRQLVVQHVMFGPDWDQPCPGCTACINSFHPFIFDQLGTRETAFAFTSRAPYDKIAAKAAELGWTIPWYSAHGSDFNYDFGVSLDADRGQIEYNYRPEPDAVGGEVSTELPGYSCFLRDGDDIYHTYSVYARGTEATVGAYVYLDWTALGRQEDWEEPKDRSGATRGGDPTFTS